MVRFAPCACQTCWGAPHPRGDGPSEREKRQRPAPCSPPAWGWSGCSLGSGGAGGVLPTRVGMVRLRRGDQHPPGGAPHPRGDGPAAAARAIDRLLCSPPAWGWSVPLFGRRQPWQVLPTRVGMVLQSGNPAECLSSAPHPRGDGPIIDAISQSRTLCSPPAWGWSA